MRVKTKSRDGFGFDLIIGFLLLVIPTTAGIVLFFIDVWSVMRIDNDVKLINYQVGLEIVNYDKAADFKDTGFQSIARTLCPSATSATTLARQEGYVINENVNDGNITLTVEAEFESNLLGKKIISHKMFLSSYNNIDAQLTYKCKN